MLQVNEQTLLDMYQSLIDDGIELSSADKAKYDSLKAKADNKHHVDTSKDNINEFNDNLIIPSDLDKQEAYAYRVRANVIYLVHRLNNFSVIVKHALANKGIETYHCERLQALYNDFVDGKFGDKNIGDICGEYIESLPSAEDIGLTQQEVIDRLRDVSEEFAKYLLNKHISCLKTFMLYYARCQHEIIMAAEFEAYHLQNLTRAYEMLAYMDYPICRESLYTIYGLFYKLTRDTIDTWAQLPQVSKDEPISVNPDVDFSTLESHTPKRMTTAKFLELLQGLLQ